MPKFGAAIFVPFESTTNQLLPLHCVVSGSSGPTGTGFQWSKLCFIVSAAADFANAERVSGLVGLRDMLMRRSALGAAIFTQLFSDYYQFSPRVAAEMKAAPELRRSVSELIVEPLIDFFEIVGSYALGDRDQAQCDEAFESSVWARRTKLAAVTCRVQYAEVPFHPTRESAAEINRELAEWGTRTERRFLARIGEEGRVTRATPSDERYES